MTSVPTSSLDPYLRARSVDPASVPYRSARSSQHRPEQSADTDEDFAVFLQKLPTFLFSPVTVPLKWISTTATSPLTISLGLKLLLLGFLTLVSAVFSLLAVGAWWYSWGTSGPVELEGWLFYGSKSLRTPHVLVPLPVERFQEDLRYDVQVEMELVRPVRGQEEMGNFMLSLELRSAKDQDLVVIGASQPSLPPPALQSGFISFPTFPTQLIPPCIIPWPLRPLCPSRLLGYETKPARKVRERRAKGFASPARGKEVVLLRKQLMDGVMVKPSRGGDAEVGSVFVSIGREDAFTDVVDNIAGGAGQLKEIRTTGWVVIRFVPKPTGIRWLLSAHPLPPLLILPPLTLALALSSSLFAFLIISYVFRDRSTAVVKVKTRSERPLSEASLMEEKRNNTFAERDRAERREEARRRKEWEEVESSVLGGMQKMPEDKKRASTIGGSETTGPSQVRSFAASLPESDESGSVTETASVTGLRDDNATDSSSDGWEEAR